MKKQILPFLTCLAAFAAGAQTPAQIEVSYTAHHPNLRNGVDDLTCQYILLAGEEASKFYSPRTEYLDSLNSSPEGKAQIQEITRNAAMSGDWDGIPRADGSYYVVKDGSNNILTYYDLSGTEKFCYDEPIAAIDWQIGDSTKSILGYECFEATADLYGRKWAVWFAPEIPLAAGPWKLAGAPGLILEAAAEGNQYRFVATGLQQTERAILPVYLADEYEKTSRLDFLRAKRAFLENPIGSINAQFASQGVSLTRVTDADGKESDRLFVPRETVDLIETDY